MAILYPPLEQIKKLTPPPTKGELELLEYFNSNPSLFDDSWEVFFQPHINSLHPDIILLRKNHGVYIIEVKDWDLSLYAINDKDDWTVKHNDTFINTHTNPVRQVTKYKNALYNLYTEELLMSNIYNTKLYAVVNTCVYFTDNSLAERIAFFERYIPSRVKINNKLPVIDDYTHIFGTDDLYNNLFALTIQSGYMGDKTSYYFNDNIYEELLNLFLPSKEDIEQHSTTPIILTNAQLKAIEIKEKGRKIRGVAGSGKTTILSALAVNYYKKYHAPVLILTFNITLRNYIRDKIKRYDPTLTKKEIDVYFSIVHYHVFTMYNEKSDLTNYGLVLIDELQDWEKDWIIELNNKSLQEDFKTQNNKKFPIFYYFADEKQNIYNRIMEEDKKPYTTIAGRWFTLGKSQRLCSSIATFSTNFAKEFFANKYKNFQITPYNESLFGGVYYIKTDTTKENAYLEVINYLKKEMKCSPNDICFIFNTIAYGRDVRDNFEHSGINPTCTFESNEEYKRIRFLYTHEIDINYTLEDFEYLSDEEENSMNLDKNFSEKKSKETFQIALQKIRRKYKFNFWMNTGAVKLSTIHSFKGWEIENIVIILDGSTANKAEEKTSLDELLYTAITRARTNLFIIETEKTKYSDFLIENIPEENFIEL